MELEEAIRQNKEWLERHTHLGPQRGYKPLPIYESIQMGVEALEAIKLIRENNGYPSEKWASEVIKIADHLPSETRED